MGASDVLSNFYPYDLKAFLVTHKSSEQGFQYVKAVYGADIPRANAIQSVHPHGLAKTIKKKFWLLSQILGHPANNIIL